MRKWWRTVVSPETLDGTACGAWIDAVTGEAAAPASASRAGGLDARAEARIAIEYACRHHHAHAAVMAPDALQMHVTEEDLWTACTRAIAPMGALWAARGGASVASADGAAGAGAGGDAPLWFGEARAVLRVETGVDDVRGARELCCLDAAWLTDAALLCLAHNNPDVDRLALCGATRVTADGLEAAAARWPGLKHLALAEMPALRSLSRRLHALSTLHVRDVGLSALPPEVVALDGSWVAWAEKVDSRDARVLRYLQAIDADGTLPCPLAKIALVGYAFEGKTTLLQALMHASAGGGFPRDVRALPSAYHRTVGVDVQQWRVPDEDRPLLATVYDFAGQEAYYATHALFLSARSLFVLVVNLYDWGEGRPRRLVGWLESVRARCPGAVVAIVGTHLDLVGPEAAESRLKEAFRIVRDWREESGAALRLGGLCAVDPVKGDAVSLNAEDPWASPARHERGADGALLAIRVLQASLALLEHVGEQVAASRVRLATLAFDHKLASGPQPFLSLAALRAALQEAEFQESMLAPDQLEDSVRFAHDLGVLSWFGQYGASVHDLVFVDPAWLGGRLSEVVFHVPFDLRVAVRPLPGEDQFGVTVEARSARVRGGEWHVMSPLEPHSWDQFRRLHVALGSPSSVASPDARARAHGAGASATATVPAGPQPRPLRERLGLLWDRARESPSDRATHLEAYVNEIVACEELGNHNVQLLEFLGLPGAEVDVQRAFVAAGMAHRDTDPAAARARDRHPALVDKYVTTGVLPRTLLEDVWSASGVPAELLDPLARVLCGVHIMCPMGAADPMGRGRAESWPVRRGARHADTDVDADFGAGAGPDAIARATQFLVPAMLPPANAFPFRAGSRWRLRSGDGDGPVLRRRVAVGRRVPDGLFGELLVTLRRQCDASYGDLEMTEWSQQHVVLRAPADGSVAIVVVSHVDEEEPQADAGGRGGVVRDTPHIVRPLNAALPGASASARTALDVVGTGSPRHRLFERVLAAARECASRCSCDELAELVPLVGAAGVRLIPVDEVVARVRRGERFVPPGGARDQALDAASLVLPAEAASQGSSSDSVGSSAAGGGASSSSRALGLRDPRVVNWIRLGRALVVFGGPLRDRVITALKALHARLLSEGTHGLVCDGIVENAARTLVERRAELARALAAADAARQALDGVAESDSAARSAAAVKHERAKAAVEAAKQGEDSLMAAKPCAVAGNASPLCPACQAVADAHSKRPQWSNSKCVLWSFAQAGGDEGWTELAKLFMPAGSKGASMRELDLSPCVTAIANCRAPELDELRTLLGVLAPARRVRHRSAHNGMGLVTDVELDAGLETLVQAAMKLAPGDGVLVTTLRGLRTASVGESDVDSARSAVNGLDAFIDTMSAMAADVRRMDDTAHAFVVIVAFETRAVSGGDGVAAGAGAAAAAAGSASPDVTRHTAPVRVDMRDGDAAVWSTIVDACKSRGAGYDGGTAAGLSPVLCYDNGDRTPLFTDDVSPHGVLHLRSGDKLFLWFR